MPCTTILVGKKASHDGSTIIARNDDGGFEAKRVLVHPAREKATTYKTVISHLTVELPGNALRYTDCPNVSKSNGVWPACGISEANVAMTATETITSNARVVGADPYVRYQPKKGRHTKEVPGGIGEEDLVTLVLPYIHSAREGVLRTGALLEQYGIFLNDLVHGRFGTSLRYGQEATQVVLEKLPATLQLASLSLLVSTVLGVVLGVLCARAKDTILDVFFNGLAVIGQAMPSFWIGIMLILLFGVMLKWLPVSGTGDWRNLVMPVATLSIVTAAQIIPLVRSSMLEIMHEDYIRTAKSKGLRERVIVYKHAFKNALIPVVTILALQVPNLIGGSLITETVFAWPGLGQLLIQCINGKDMCVVQACVVVIALVTMVANLLADLVYCLIDPRIRLAKGDD